MTGVMVKGGLYFTFAFRFCKNISQMSAFSR